MFLKRKGHIFKSFILLFLILLISGQKNSSIVSFTNNQRNSLTDSFYQKDITHNSFYMQLEIPKLALNQKIYALDSNLNQIKYNVTLLPASTLPNVENSEIFLAAHAGSSKISYFQNLNLLIEGDVVYLIYDGYKYTYQVKEIKITSKTNYVSIQAKKGSKTLTLISCLGKEKRVIVSLEQTEVTQLI